MRRATPFAVVAVAVAVGMLFGIQSATALAGVPAWNPQAKEISAPSNVDPEDPDAKLRSVSCGGVGSCSAVGSYLAQGFQNSAMVASQVAGTWQPAEAVLIPPARENPFLLSISCSSPGNCVAVGQIENSGNGEPEMLVVSETGGAWGTAEIIPPPSGSQFGYLASVSCSGNGNCEAVGSYEDGSGHREPVAVTETAGTWGAATPVGFPSGAPAGAEGGLGSVVCPEAGACTALGSFNNENNSGYFRSMVTSQSGGTWATPEEFTIPHGAQTFGAEYLSCPKAGSCTVAGVDRYEEGAPHNGVAQQSSGHWGAVTPITLPANAASGSESEIGALSCPEEGVCTALGTYIETGTEELERAFSAKETAGTWGTTEQLAVPGIPEAEFPNHIIGWTGLDCVTAQACAGTGFAYFRANTLFTENGTWGSGASSIMLPSNSQSEESGGIESLSCGGVGSCSAVGNYGETEGAQLAMVLSTEGTVLQAEDTLTVTKAGSGGGTVTSVPGGISCGSTCSHAFSQGAAVTLTASPSAGSTFTGWSGAGCSGTGTCQVTMNADESVTATFAPQETGGEGNPHSGGGSTPSGGSSPPPPPTPTQPKKALHCRKGFKKEKVHGKERCVKAKTHGKRHH